MKHQQRITAIGLAIVLGITTVACGSPSQLNRATPEPTPTRHMPTQRIYLRAEEFSKQYHIEFINDICSAPCAHYLKTNISLEKWIETFGLPAKVGATVNMAANQFDAVLLYDKQGLLVWATRSAEGSYSRLVTPTMRITTIEFYEARNLDDFNRELEQYNTRAGWMRQAQDWKGYTTY
jgi:hypothetical protein